MRHGEVTSLAVSQVATQAPTQPCMSGGRFTGAERHLLLTTSGIGQVVINRIESAGVGSLRQLRELGVDTIVERICDGAGNFAWRNRKRALLRALAMVDTAPADATAPELHTTRAIDAIRCRI